MKDYDYIILGAGASGLMLAYRMASDLFFDNKSILILDKDTDKNIRPKYIHILNSYKDLKKSITDFTRFILSPL